MLSSYNFWFVIEDRDSAAALRKANFTPDVNATWFPATGDTQRPFPTLLTAVQRFRVDALFYESYHQPFPPISLMRQVPTVVSLDAAPLRSFIRERSRSLKVSSVDDLLRSKVKIKEDQLQQAAG